MILCRLVESSSKSFGSEFRLVRHERAGYDERTPPQAVSVPSHPGRSTPREGGRKHSDAEQGSPEGAALAHPAAVTDVGAPRLCPVETTLKSLRRVIINRQGAGGLRYCADAIRPAPLPSGGKGRNGRRPSRSPISLWVPSGRYIRSDVTDSLRVPDCW
jgi:hypothetical protein